MGSRLGAPSSVALLARLLMAPGAPVSTGELLEAAWPEERRAAAAASLRVRLSKLRALLEPDRERGAAAEVLVRDPAGYRLVVEPERVDAERFARLAEEASRVPPAAALGRCEQALELWRGEPFADLDLVEVAAAEARRLHGMRDPSAAHARARAARARARGRGGAGAGCARRRRSAARGARARPDAGPLPGRAAGGGPGRLPGAGAAAGGAGADSRAPRCARPRRWCCATPTSWQAPRPRGRGPHSSPTWGRGW